ncbi:hypothetical protein Mgra_00006079 [Meloidogyne graminicola]|uniref:Uncharacterized protein n=1 Tax=Meloidogyne graminicola TaxID=189291 RepID=A0A8S9ZMW0_9BILA|nr:hypothetical protein Mgra_00006079 [Meloidogyne graminicola]
MDPRHFWVQSLQRGLELELNGALNEAEDASRAAKENNRILTGISAWLDKRAELQRTAAEIDRKRREEHAKIHTQWKGKFSELEKEMHEKQFHQKIDLLEEWRRIEDLNIEREWNQKRSALESSELICSKILNKEENIKNNEEKTEK